MLLHNSTSSMFYAAEYERETKRRTEPSSFRSPEKVTESIRKTQPDSQCLKISEKVAFNIKSEASYVYILRQKFIKNAKNGPFWRVFENLKIAVKQCYQTDHLKKGQKLAENAINNQFGHFLKT